MLETVREYAREKLQESGEEEAVRACHAEHYLALAEQAHPFVEKRNWPGWTAWRSNTTICARR
jgi:predicted ATPase